MRLKFHRNTFLEFEKPPTKKKRDYKVRRKRHWKWDEEEHVWRNIDPPKVVPTPSNDPNELFFQITGRPKVEDMLEFLPLAVDSHVFNWTHVYAAVTKLAKQRKRMTEQQKLEDVRQSDALREVAQKGVAILEALDPTRPLDDPDKLVVMLRATATLAEEAPQLHPLASAIGEKLQSHIGAVKKTNVVYMLWSIAQLRAHCPDLQDELLPRILSHEDFRGIRQMVRSTLKLEGAYLWNAFMKLKNDVPELREFLPET